MDVVFTFIIPIVGFALAVVGAWDKLVFWFKYFSKKQTERKLKLAQSDLEEVEKYNTNQTLLIAYLFKQTALLITVIFFMSVFDLAPTFNVLGLQVKAFSFGLMSGVMGFVSGRIFRVANYVIDYDKIKGKLDSKIYKYSVGA
jgi:hypothetical protein